MYPIFRLAASWSALGFNWSGRLRSTAVRICCCTRCQLCHNRPGNSFKTNPRQGDADSRPSVILHPVAAPLRAGLTQALGAMSLLSSLKERANDLKRYTLVVYFAARDPRTPLLVRVLALLVAAYALSPVDLIPDFIPVLGYLDDLVLVPLGLALVIRLLPTPVLASAREQAERAAAHPTSKLAGRIILAVWLLVLLWLGWWTIAAMRT